MLEARNIHKVYSNGKRELEVLKGVDLKIDKGRFVAIVGPSGAGKSTLLHILGGLDMPTQGEVILDKENIYTLNNSLISRLRNEKIGFVFQFYHLLPDFTVLENVLMPAWISPQAVTRSSRNRAGELLAKIGLQERMGHFPNQLSGGEKQRLAIARALINSPQILFCDEPTGNLDSQTGNEIIDLIRKISRQNGMTVVLVTHNLELAGSLDKVYHLRDGILVNPHTPF